MHAPFLVLFAVFRIMRFWKYCYELMNLYIKCFAVHMQCACMYACIFMLQLSRLCPVGPFQLAAVSFHRDPIHL